MLFCKENHSSLPTKTKYKTKSHSFYYRFSIIGYFKGLYLAVVFFTCKISVPLFQGEAAEGANTCCSVKNSNFSRNHTFKMYFLDLLLVLLSSNSTTSHSTKFKQLKDVQVFFPPKQT